MTIAAPTSSRSFRFCGRSFPSYVLKPEMPIGRWMAEADTWLSRSPGFFAGKTVVMDVSGLTLSKSTMANLVADLSARDIRVMGLLGADRSLVDPTLPPMLSPGRMAESGEAQEMPMPQQPTASVQTPSIPSLLVDSPVRSGQSLFHEGDVTVIGSVSSGAEIVATGSIHIYGTLRGRLMAGADGNPGAHIFCRRLEAELISIDGYYVLADGITDLLGKSVHAWLEAGRLNIKTLD